MAKPDPHTTPHPTQPWRSVSGRILPTSAPADDNKKKPAARAAHPGFSAAAGDIMGRENVTRQAANRILAAGARRASPAAKAANPRLNKVSSGKKPRGEK